MLAAIFAIVLAQAAPAARGPEPGELPMANRPGPGVQTAPEWIRTPSDSDVNRAFPAAAKRAKQSGSAMIACEVSPQGVLADCAVTSEDPRGGGFGQAALGLSKLYRMKPATRNGAPVDGGTVRIPMRWRLP